MSENTGIDFLRQVCAGSSSAVGEFISSYTGFLEYCLRRGLVHGGFRVCSISYPNDDKETVIEKLMPLILRVCAEFVQKVLTREFFEEYKRKLELAQTDPKAKSSIRTVLQYTFVNRLKKECFDSGVICAVCKNGDIELYSKDEMTGTEKIPMSRESLSSLLRRLRIVLTRLAGKGDISLYPTAYECYCLKYGCFDRSAYIGKYISSPELQEELKRKKIFNETDVSLILTARYAGKKGVSCERRTINNRIREYRELLDVTLLHYCPELREHAKLVEKVLKTSGTVSEEEILMVSTALVQSLAERGAAAPDTKTRTAEFENART